MRPRVPRFINTIAPLPLEQALRDECERRELHFVSLRSVLPAPKTRKVTLTFGSGGNSYWSYAAIAPLPHGDACDDVLFDTLVAFLDRDWPHVKRPSPPALTYGVGAK